MINDQKTIEPNKKNLGVLNVGLSPIMIISKLEQRYFYIPFDDHEILLSVFKLNRANFIPVSIYCFF